MTIANGQIDRTLRVLKVAQASPVTIEWTVDRPTTVHLEGYDISIAVHPGRPATMQFLAHASGRYAVHAHAGEHKGKHAHGHGVLLHLEVHPR